MKFTRLYFVILAIASILSGQIPLLATEPATSALSSPVHVFSPEALDKLLAPIALYPDPLLAQILPAATTPSDIVLAARYIAAKKDPNKIDQQSWEESVKAIARYPDVLKMMDEKLDWTTELGEAFVAQPKDVFASVQRLRAQAEAVGNLKDTQQQVIVKEKEIIKIMPAEPDVVYVPVYQPDVVYVQAAPTPAATLITFSAGLALGLWIHNELDWHHHHVYYHNSGWHGGNYHGGNNSINIDNSTNINIGNGNGNVWKPQNKPRPQPYGQNGNDLGSKNNWSSKPGNGSSNGLNRSSRTNNNKSTAWPAQQKSGQKPAQSAARSGNNSRPGFMSEGTKPRSTGGSSAMQRSSPGNRGSGGQRG